MNLKLNVKMNMKRLTLAIVLMAIVMGGYAKGLALKVYNPGTNAIFPVTSTIVYGKKDAALIDAQFQKQYAEELVRQIKALKKNLKYVFVSYHDPDFYFGLNVIHKAFPEAQIISTAQTAYLIEASKDFKLNVWKGQLGADTPDSLLVPQPVDPLPWIGGNSSQTATTRPTRSYGFQAFAPSLVAAVCRRAPTSGWPTQRATRGWNSGRRSSAT